MRWQKTENGWKQTEAPPPEQKNKPEGAAPAPADQLKNPEAAAPDLVAVPTTGQLETTTHAPNGSLQLMSVSRCFESCLGMCRKPPHRPQTDSDRRATEEPAPEQKKPEAAAPNLAVRPAGKIEIATFSAPLEPPIMPPTQEQARV